MVGIGVCFLIEIYERSLIFSLGILQFGPILSIGQASSIPFSYFKHSQ
jgi:hypothetical protein